MNTDFIMPLKAIVIDDDHDTARIFSEFLTENGFEIVAVGHSGKEAVNLYALKKPDVVFLDIMMSEGSGFYAIRKITKPFPNAKIIVVTADIRITTKEKLNELGIPVVYKPFEIEDLMKFL